MIYPRYPDNVEIERLHRERTNADDIVSIKQDNASLIAALEDAEARLWTVVTALVEALPDDQRDAFYARLDKGSDA